jgi:hypothetical protein
MSCFDGCRARRTAFSIAARTIVVQTAQTRAITRAMCMSADDFHSVFHRNCEDRSTVCR